MADSASNREKARMFMSRISNQESRNRRRDSLSEDHTAALGLVKLWWKPRMWSDQQCSALFRLPTELRLKIYELVLCGELMLHIVPDFEGRRFRLRGCRLSQEQKDGGPPEEADKEAMWPSLHFLCLDRAAIMEDYEYGCNPEVGEKPEITLLPLLLTCRRV